MHPWRSSEWEATRGTFQKDLCGHEPRRRRHRWLPKRQKRRYDRAMMHERTAWARSVVRLSDAAMKGALGLNKTCREVIRRGGGAAGRGPKAAFCTILRPLQFRVGPFLQIPQWRYQRFTNISNDDDLSLPCLVFQSQSDRQIFMAPCSSPCLYRRLCSGG